MRANVCMSLPNPSIRVQAWCTQSGLALWTVYYNQKVWGRYLTRSDADYVAAKLREQVAACAS